MSTKTEPLDLDDLVTRAHDGELSAEKQLAVVNEARKLRDGIYVHTEEYRRDRGRRFAPQRDRRLSSLRRDEPRRSARSHLPQ